MREPRLAGARPAPRGRCATRHLRDLFASDPGRVERLSFEAAGIHADLSKHRVTDETVRLLVAPRASIETCRRGATRCSAASASTRPRTAPALHVALRMPRDRSLVVDGRDVVREVHDVLDRMAGIRRRRALGCVARAHRRADPGRRQHRHRRLRPRPGDGVRGAPRLRATGARRPIRLERRRDRPRRGAPRPRAGETLVDRLVEDVHDRRDDDERPRRARQWLVDGLGGDEAAIAKHVVAVSTNLDAVAAFGIDPANAFGFWDWVGGRYSMDSAIGLSTMIAIGPERLPRAARGLPRRRPALRRDAARAQPARADGAARRLVPQLLRRGRRTPSCPYEQYLARFPAYLQQLVMESNGKRVTLDGEPVGVDTAPIVWGEPGTNGQHSFHQLLHQGTALVPVDFIAFATSLNPLGRHHDLLLANALAQAQALAFGRTGGRAASGRSAGGARAAQGDAGQPALDVPPAAAADAVRARLARRPLRACRLHAGRRLGDRLVRPVGRRARQGARAAAYAPVAGPGEPATDLDASTEALVAPHPPAPFARADDARAPRARGRLRANRGLAP